MKYIKKYIKYNPDTGEFTWIRKYKNNTIVGSTVGSNCNGYIRLSFNKKGYYCHRLAWWWTYGYWPKMIDHINRIKDDNRIENLREVNYRENNINTSKRKSSSSYRGVRWDKYRNKWSASISLDKKTYYLGRFNTELEAAEAYKNKAKELFKDIIDINTI